MAHVCTVCEGENFEERHGKYFCLDCGTQSQDSHVEMSQSFDTDNMSRGQQNKMTVKKKSVHQSSSKRKPHSLGKPWVIFEGFQLMIKAHVESLIHMGFPESLNGIVKQLWYSYLRNQNIAFCDNEDSSVNIRAEHSGRHKNIGILPSGKRKGKDVPLDEGDFLKIKHELEDNEFYEEDLPHYLVDDVKHESDIDGDVKENIGSLDVDMKYIYRPQLNQASTLVLPYLGLLYLHEPILLSDMIRWATLGQLPYHKANEIFPDELKFSHNDASYFNTKKCPNIFKVNFQAKEMATLLEVDFGYSLENCQTIALSIVTDLQLPGIVGDVACFFMEIVNFSYQYDTKLTREMSETFVLESFVGAYITIATKCLYYLDDNHELKDHLNTYMLNVFNCKNNPPTWKEWVTTYLIQKKSRLKSGIPDNETDLYYIEDLTTYMNYIHKDVYNSFEERKTTLAWRNNNYTWHKAIDKKAMTKYTEIFTELAQTYKEDFSLENSKTKPTSFPYSQNSQTFESHVYQSCSDVVSNDLIERICGSSTCQSCFVKENKMAESFTFLVYKRFMDLKNMHESFRCFTKIIASRLLLQEEHILKAYFKVEEDIFSVKQKMSFNVNLLS